MYKPQGHVRQFTTNLDPNYSRKAPKVVRKVNSKTGQNMFMQQLGPQQHKGVVGQHHRTNTHQFPTDMLSS